MTTETEQQRRYYTFRIRNNPANPVGNLRSNPSLRTKSASWVEELGDNKIIPVPLARGQQGSLMVPSVFLSSGKISTFLRDKRGKYFIQEAGGNKEVYIPSGLRYEDGTIKSGLDKKEYSTISYQKADSMQR
jgi:hypothetical protein